MIKVLQERRVKKINYDRLIAHLIDLRAAALRQPGYLTGETLSKGDDPVDVLTISTWVSEANWKAWVTSEERIEFEEIINNLLDGEAKVSIYKMPAEED
jgi:heme-degrading monooxygenase HmoA